jgi:hypothetical protein
MAKFGDPVIVEWRDHWHMSSQMDLEELRKQKALTYHTVGWLVDEDDEYVYVASTIDPPGEKFDGIWALLKANILSMYRCGTAVNMRS